MPALFATPSPSLAEDIRYIGSLSLEYLEEFCRAAVALLRQQAPMTKMYVNAAKMLSVEPVVVENCVQALAYVMQRAAAVGAPPPRLLEGIDLTLSDEAQEALTNFYTGAQAELSEVCCACVGASEWRWRWR